MLRLDAMSDAGSQVEGAAEAERPEAAIARVLGHTSTVTTRKHTDRKLRRVDAEAYAEVLVPRIVPQGNRKASG